MNICSQFPQSKAMANNWHIYIIFFSMTQETLPKRGQIGRAIKQEGLVPDSFYKVWKYCHTHKLTEDVVVYTRPLQDQASQQHHRWQWGSPKPHLSSGATGSWWLLVVEESVFFRGVVLGHWPCPSRWPYTSVFRNSTNWAQYKFI